MGKFIVLEGLDGSGKSTQFELLLKYFNDNKFPLKQLKFPDYENESSALIKLYLSGAIGSAGDVNAYAATSFYAADRYISYETSWKQDFQNGVNILADRYTTSNIIYQMSKLPKEQWDEYIDWIWDYEFSKLGLPEPTRVIYLDVEPKVSQKLLAKRYKGDESKKDIHEKDLDFLINCRGAALYAASKLGWSVISCTENDEMLPIDTISDAIKFLI